MEAIIFLLTIIALLLFAIVMEFAALLSKESPTATLVTINDKLDVLQNAQASDMSSVIKHLEHLDIHLYNLVQISSEGIRFAELPPEKQNEVVTALLNQRESKTTDKEED